MKKNSSVVFFLVGLSQFVTMAFLIIGSITAPIFKQIGYSKYDEITYGTFGYCKEGPAQKQVIIITPMSYQTVIATGNSIATLGLYWGKSSLSHPLLLVLIFWDFLYHHERFIN